MTFSEQLRAKFEESGEDDALDLVFEVFDDYLIEGRFAECDATLLEVRESLGTLPITVAICVLCATLALTSEKSPYALSNRQAIYEDLRIRTLRERGPEESRGLLQGLERITA